MRITLLAWWLKCGGDILTVMKQDWLLYKTGAGDASTSNTNSDDPEYSSAEEAESATKKQTVIPASSIPSRSLC